MFAAFHKPNKETFISIPKKEPDFFDFPVDLVQYYGYR